MRRRKIMNGLTKAIAVANLRSRTPTATQAGLMARYRRRFAALTFLLLVTPLVWGMLLPDSADFIFREGRRLAPTPALPTDLAGLAALPAQLDAYLKDRFGLRHAMIKLHKDLTHPVLLKVNTAALVGRDGRLFYQGNEMVRQSAGIVLRDARVAEAADLVASMRDALEKRGVRFLVTVPPNASTIYQDDLPVWAQRQGRKTEYDLFLEDLAARGVKAIDLRPALNALRERGEEVYLMNDAHWTPRGAITGFNAVVEADGRPDWRIDPATAIGPLERRKGGDIARILGVQDEVSEMAESFVLPLRGKDHALSDAVMPDHVVTTGMDGPTVLVIGDSFTAGYFPMMLSQHVGRAVWIHHHECGFDWKLIDEFRPDEVWWAPTERFLVCDIGARPVGFPG
jgi:hypothetical protein